MSRRRFLGWFFAITLVLSLAVIYSLAGWMTGVYRLPAIDTFAPGKGYLVSDGNRWLTVFVWEGGQTIGGEEMSSERAKIIEGIWVMDLHVVRTSDSTHAITPMNLIDVYALRFGYLSEEVKKLGPTWSESTVAP